MKNINLTKRGIAKDLSKSPYIFTYIHNNIPVNLYFSSKLHLDNFVKNRTKNYSMIYNYINKRFKFKTDCTFLSDLNLYQKIENRGCYIKFDNLEYRNINHITIK